MSMRRRTFFKYSEEDLLKAIEEIHNGAQFRKTGRKYGIPHSTLINKIKLCHPIERKMGPSTILTSQEENLISKWIIAMAKKGFPVRKEDIIETVSTIIRTDGRPTPFKDGTPERKWFMTFMKRHKEISQRHAESINVARSQITESAIRKWHSELRQYLICENAADILDDPDRIINADESGFQTCPSSGLVLGPRGYKNLYNIRDKEKESITVLGTFTASGKVIPPLIIFPYVRIPSEIAKNMNKDWCIGRSKKGWMTSRVFYGYIANTLIPALKKINVKFPVLFLIDGHKSHINYEIAKLCLDNRIILYSLYPNATHILQPADVSVFRPLKNSWKTVVHNWKLKTGRNVVTRAQFAPLLENALKAVTPTTICNGFKKCGIYPFDADAIDYTKCISDSSRQQLQDKPAEIGPEHLLFFESLMPAGRVQEFRNVKEDEQWQADESASELFFVWRKIKAKVNTLITTVNSTNGENEVQTNNNYDNVENTAVYNTGNTEEIGNVQDVSADETIEVCHQLPFSNNCILNTTQPLQLQTAQNSKINPQEEDFGEAEQSNTIGKAVSCNISPAFANAILWPTESPPKGKRRTTARLPDAINSTQWFTYWKEKEKEKIEKEQKKKSTAEKRKRKQIESKTNRKESGKRIIYSDSESEN